MKGFVPQVLVIISALSNADANGMKRGLHRGGGHRHRHGGGHGGHGHHGRGYGFGSGHGHHGRHGDRMQTMIQDECDLFKCDAIDPDNLNCNTERPERPNFSAMTEEEKENAWITVKAEKEEHRQQILECACCTDATIEDLLPRDEDSFHGHGHGHGHHGGHGDHPFMQMMMEDVCDLLECEDKDNLDCNIERLERPDFTGLTEEDEENAWIAMKAERKEHRQKITRCACCTDATIDELIPAEDGDSLFGFGPYDGMMSSSSHGGMMSSSSHGGSGMPGKGFHGHHGRGQGMKVQHMLETHCPMHECPNGGSEIVECSRLDTTVTKSERREKALNCVCCNEDGVSELKDSNEGEVSVLLASLLPAESRIEANPAIRNAVSMAFSFAAFTLLLVTV